VKPFKKPFHQKQLLVSEIFVKNPLDMLLSASFLSVGFFDNVLMFYQFRAFWKLMLDGKSGLRHLTKYP